MAEVVVGASLSACSLQAGERSVRMQSADARLDPEERLREVAAILAGGILRLKALSRIPLPQTESAAVSPRKESSNPARN